MEIFYTFAYDIIKWLIYLKYKTDLIIENSIKPILNLKRPDVVSLYSSKVIN